MAVSPSISPIEHAIDNAETSSRDGESVLHHVEEGVQVGVTQRKGQVLHINASAHIQLSPAQTFALIMHPQNEQIFSHLERCTDRAVLEDDGEGHVVLESEHTARWRLLMLSGTMATRLRIEQDWTTCTAQFALVRTGFSPMRAFKGTWTVTPDRGSESGCLLALDQELQPAVFMLPPLGVLLKRIAAKQVRGVFADLQAEAVRIHAGKPTLRDHPSV